MSLPVNVKLPGGNTILVQAEKQWTVEELTSEIGRNGPNMDKDRIRVLFCGQELSQGDSLLNLDLGEYSTLHVVEASAASTPAHNHSPMERRRAKYYVYCKAVCKGVQPGKLRVRCNLCKEGAITLEREPSRWSDVLRPNHISIKCHTDACTGNKAEFYFKCSQHMTTEDSSAVVLNLVHTNTSDAICVTCGDVSEVLLVFPCVIRHSMCLDCFRQYCHSKLNERAFIAHHQYGYTLGCPAGCEDSLIQEAHHFRILGDEQYGRYQRFGTEEWVLSDWRGVLCPGPGCGQGWVRDADARRLECQPPQGCGMVFCGSCREEYHDGPCVTALSLQRAASGDAIQGMSTTQQERFQSLTTIQEISKPCPKCKTPVERSGKCLIL